MNHVFNYDRQRGLYLPTIEFSSPGAQRALEYGIIDIKIHGTSAMIKEIQVTNSEGLSVNEKRLFFRYDAKNKDPPEGFRQLDEGSNPSQVFTNEQMKSNYGWLLQKKPEEFVTKKGNQYKLAVNLDQLLQNFIENFPEKNEVNIELCGKNFNNTPLLFHNENFAELAKKYSQTNVY